MKTYRALFAATVFAFNMPNFPVLFGRVGFVARYFFLVTLVLGTVVFAVKKPVRVPSAVLASFYLFVTYAFVTSFWTENVSLSVVKLLLYVSATLALFVGGVVVCTSKQENPFWPLKWIFVPIVLISTFALVRGIGWVAGNFRGYCGNSNALAATMVLTSPWLIYELRGKWSQKRERLALMVLSGAAVIILLCTFSRAAIGALFIVLAYAGWSLKLGRKFLIGYAVVGLLVGVYVLRPATYTNVYQGLVEKRSENVMNSRSEQLQDSWEAAKQGGWFGVGFGVSVGSSRYWDMESFSSFAREKGNTMLAVVEELGITGFALYLVLLYSMWGSLRHLSRSVDADGKFIYIVSLGFFFGAIFHSAFEAWFLSTGPDLAVFWSSMGLIMGTLRLHSRQANERFSRLETAAGSRVFVPSPAPRG